MTEFFVQTVRIGGKSIPLNRGTTKDPRVAELIKSALGEVDIKELHLPATAEVARLLGEIIWVGPAEEEVLPGEQPAIEYELETAPGLSTRQTQFLCQRVKDVELSIRVHNCLEVCQINFLWQLVTNRESDLLKTKNLGRKSLNEIKEFLGEEGLYLNMKLSEYNWPTEDELA
ncbi:MAG: DNA-directed RNA polymerase subunit alpha C-terminal domain-containing protein [Candidatus Uhrbacteria bacterium]